MLKLPTVQKMKPNHRAIRILNKLDRQGKYVTDDAVEEAFVRLLRKRRGVPEHLIYAYDVYITTHKREIVEAFYLAGGDNRDLVTVFDIDEYVLDIYRYLFFDTDVFQDRLDVINYAKNYPKNRHDGFGYEVKNDAVELGLEYLKVNYGANKYVISPKKALDHALNQAFLSSAVASKYPVDHPKNQSARQWSSLALQSVRSYKAAHDVEGASDENLEWELTYQDRPKDRPKLISEQDISEEDIIH